MSVDSIDLTGGSSTINRAVAPHLISDYEFEFGTDVLFDRPGYVRQRGPLKRAQNTDPSNTPTVASSTPYAIVHCIDPAGIVKVGLLLNVSSQMRLYVLSSDYETATNVDNWGVDGDVIATSPSVGQAGGIWIGSSLNFVTSSNALLWRGASVAGVVEPATETISCTRGSTTVTGSGTSFLTEASSGSFLFARTDTFTSTSCYIGVVKSVTNDTELVLEAGALDTSTTKAYTLTGLRNRQNHQSRGKITCTTTSTALTGGNTKFRSGGLDNSWYLFRRRDMAYIGKVSTVVDEDSITLAANAAVDATNEEYVAIDIDKGNAVDSNNTATGFITATYANRQWWLGANYSNGLTDIGSTAIFSDLYDGESVYLEKNVGDLIVVPNYFSETNTPILGAVGTFSGLMIFRENETSLLLGDSPDQFVTRPLYKDGLLHPQSIAPYENGIVWAGRRGIHYFDGASVINLTRDTLGDWYVRNFNDYDYKTNSVWAIVHRDHYIVYLEGQDTTFVINLKSGAVSEFTNVQIRGGTNLPGEATLASNKPWAVIKDTTGASYIVDVDNLFDESGVDNLTCTGETIGPNIKLESKIFSLNESMIKKFWKALAMNYRAVGSTIKVEVATGLDGSYAALTPTPNSFATSSTYVRKRVKFHKFNEFIRFRLTPTTASALSQFWFNDLSLFFRFQRKERF